MPASIRFDLTQFRAKLAVLRRPQAPLARALNKSLVSGVTIGSRLVAEDLGLNVGVVKKATSTSKATSSNLVATISANPKPIPLIDFKARGPEPSRRRPGGVRAALPGGAGVYPNAFIATMRSGHRGVFRRKAGAGRLPILEMHGPSVWHVFQKFEDDIRARVLEQLTKNVSSEIAYALSQVR